MTDEIPWYEAVAFPALLRHSRSVYGDAMRRALAAAGYDDVPANGLYVIGGLALNEEIPLGQLIGDLRISKQAAGQLVDTLVLRGYLERTVDPDDRRRLDVGLTERGRDAARVQATARTEIDEAIIARVGAADVAAARRTLAALIELRADSPE